MKMDEDNEKENEILNISKIQRFLRNYFWNNIGCIILEPTFGVGGGRMV